MEDGLEREAVDYVLQDGKVLILVLMEDGLEPELTKNCWRFDSLNPCFNGRWSRTKCSQQKQLGAPVLILVLMEDGLERNPIRWGIWRKQVLILVLMEDGLEQKLKQWNKIFLSVLILVLMEDGLERDGKPMALKAES